MNLSAKTQSSLLQEVMQIAVAAGKQVMEIYSREDFETTLKKDNSPLTLADTLSHQWIVERLGRLSPDWPILTEESNTVNFRVRQGWETFWLVDPLDGTKEFIKRNGEFTINIALIKGKEPVLGVVVAPAKEAIYYAEKGKGAFVIEGKSDPKKIRVNSHSSGVLKVVSSRSHSSPEEAIFLNKIGPLECIHVGSSLKLCQVAEGKAHLYPRFWPSMEWDTAAAHCVVVEAGGLVTDLSGAPLEYNKKSLLNPFFMVSSLPIEFWKQFIA